MVIPFLPFVGLTVAALVKRVVTDYTAGMAKKKLSQSFLIERLDKKMERKLGKNFLKKKLNKENLEEVRQIIHEELGAFSPGKDLDQLIVNSAQKLSDEHQEILVKLDSVESLLKKISIPLAYSLSKESKEEIPEELISGLLEGSILGLDSSQKVLLELTEDEQVPMGALDNVKEFSFINQINIEGHSEISQLVKKFTNTPEEINSLSTLMEISNLLVGQNEELENLISEFLFKMMDAGVDTKIIENSVISFCFLIHRLGKLDLLSESDRLILSSFLRKHIQKKEDPTRMVEAYYLLSTLGMADDINTTFIKEILDQHQRQGVNSTKEMAGQLRVDGKIARFLKRLGFRKSKPETSILTIRHLIRKLDKRKFVRITQLLKYQLERLTTEMNFLITYFERKDPAQVDLEEIIELIQLLLEILNRPRVYQLDLETRKRVVELMDAAYYLYDLLSIRNSWNLLNEYQLDVKSIYSPTLGNYERVTTDQAAFNIALSKFSIRQIDRDLPSPPRKKIRKKIK